MANNTGNTGGIPNEIFNNLSNAGLPSAGKAIDEGIRSGGLVFASPQDSMAYYESIQDTNRLAPNTNSYQGGAAPVADPYAQFGGRAVYDNLVNGFMDQKNTALNSANTAANTARDNRGLDILDFLDKMRLGQQGIESKAQNNERARLTGMEDVRTSLGTGTRNVGAMLAGRNASGASVGGDIARALADQGRRQGAKIENQYQLGNMDVNNAQEALNVEEASGVRRFNQAKDDTVNTIVSSVEQQLSALNSAMATATLPERIAIEQEKTTIRNNALAALSAHDATLNNGLAGINAGTTDTRRGEANRQKQLGTPMGTEFQYDSQIPIELQGTGGFSSSLPLFTLPGNKRQIA